MRALAIATPSTAWSSLSVGLQDGHVFQDLEETTGYMNVDSYTSILQWTGRVLTVKERF